MKKHNASAVHSTTSHISPKTAHSAPCSLQLPLLLLYAIALSNASPISVPEIVGKSGKSINGGTPSSASLMIKPNIQDAQLNSLNAYATNYGQIAAQHSNNVANNAGASSSSSIHSNTNTNNFKPSYKLPDVESNFTPIQRLSSVNIVPHAAPLTGVAPHVNSISSDTMPQPTPVLMQYLPQAMSDAGVHYLQLIPTRPLIVPISPYLSGGNAATSAMQSATHALHPPLAAAINGGPFEYAPHTPAILSAENINVAAMQQQQQQQHHPTPTATLLDVSNAATMPYGLQTYANAIQPYRNSYRINREVKGKNFPGTMVLNMNEYIPGPNEALRPLYMRGRP
ncbi:uncharacterized protein LOC118748227 [Rhagoletis pomonella]|uniref:uncharacterized protein LOC118748227 n=1 Tax=Rhagoletis pomonella TaxID=28610 RepID=UPI00177D8600|nr:uncharacterized protein LOC118748227 [Rhagoletis pomonella]